MPRRTSRRSGGWKTWVLSRVSPTRTMAQALTLTFGPCTVKMLVNSGRRCRRLSVRNPCKKDRVPRFRCGRCATRYPFVFRRLAKRRLLCNTLMTNAKFPRRCQNVAVVSLGPWSRGKLWSPLEYGPLVCRPFVCGGNRCSGYRCTAHVGPKMKATRMIYMTAIPRVRVQRCHRSSAGCTPLK